MSEDYTFTGPPPLAKILNDMDMLRADNARLRAKLKAHEFDECDGTLCSSCLPLWQGKEWEHVNEHHPDCPDFTPDGEVR
jgi:hypothetical protein